jgi:hypothetical protein
MVLLVTYRPRSGQNRRFFGVSGQRAGSESLDSGHPGALIRAGLAVFLAKIAKTPVKRSDRRFDRRAVRRSPAIPGVVSGEFNAGLYGPDQIAKNFFEARK